MLQIADLFGLSGTVVTAVNQSKAGCLTEATLVYNRKSGVTFARKIYANLCQPLARRYMI